MAACQADDQRRVDRQVVTIGEAWEKEKPCLGPLPKHDFDYGIARPVVLNGYCQVEFEGNRYSVPSDMAYPNLVLKAYPFVVEIQHDREVIARHPRCYGRKQDLLDPLHYLPLLEQRPGAFEHAIPIRRWRKTWPPVYERFLERLQAQGPNGQGIRQFVRVLKLHRDYPAELVARAVEQALEYGCVHADGVELCLRQLLRPEALPPPLALADQPLWAAVAAQPPDLTCYDRLLEGV